MDHRPQKGKESKGADQQAQRLEQEPKIIPRTWSLVEFASTDLNTVQAQWDFSGGPWWRIFLQCRIHRRVRFDPWVGKICWRRAWQPLQCSCLENPMSREAWWARVSRATKSHTWLRWPSTHTYWGQGSFLTFIDPFYRRKMFVLRYACLRVVF